MDSREFVNEIKRYAVDDTVEQVMRSLRSPRLFNVSSEFEQSGMNGLATWHLLRLTRLGAPGHS